MKTLFKLLTLIIILSGCNEKRWDKYLVEISFCDGRPKEYIVVSSEELPNNERIRVYQQAVPTYLNKLNVCNVKTIKKYNK